MKNMKLKDIIKTLVLAGGVLLLTPAAADIPASSEAKHPDSSEDVSSIRQKELDMLREKYRLAYPKASEKEIETARIQLQLHQLKRVNESEVTGKNLLKNGTVSQQEARKLGSMARALAAAAVQEKQCVQQLNLFLDYLFTQNVIESIPAFRYSNYSDVRNVPADFLSALLVCDRQRKIRLIAAVKHLVEAEKMYLSAEKIREQVNSDYIYNVTPHLFVCALHNPDNKLAARDLSAFSHFLSACTQYSPSGQDVLKPDGTGFHHNSHYNGYMYAYKTWVEYMGKLKGTSFRIKKDAYQRMRKAIVSLYLMAVRSDSDKNRIFGNSMAGRHPFYGTEVAFSQDLFETLIEVGGDIDGVPYDPELASWYNYFYKTKKYADVPEVNADGYYQFNFSPAGVYRKDNWVAVMRCPTTVFWGGEIYSRQNRFGRYQSHGTLEVLYEGGLVPSGYPADKEKKDGGWDWNMMPGSTTVHYTDWKDMMPGGNDTDRFDQKSSTTNFSGALAWKDCGLFAAAFDQDDRWGNPRFRATNLKFCKSTFAIDGMLFSLGTGIEAQGEYPDDYITATNLFQAVTSKGYRTLTVNGKDFPQGHETAIGPEECVWMVTPVTTGYYIPRNHDKLVIKYIEQETPSVNGIAAESGKETVAKAYLEHGVKPEEADYQFMVVPAATPERMKDIADKQEQGQLFKVMAERDSLHVIKHCPTSTIAYAFFAPASGLSYGTVCASGTELLVMERKDKNGNGLELALCNPNLRPEMLRKNYWESRPTPMAIELKGKWKLKPDKKVSGLTIGQNERGNTILKAKLAEGNPIYVSLIKL